MYPYLCVSLNKKTKKRDIYIYKYILRNGKCLPNWNYLYISTCEEDLVEFWVPSLQSNVNFRTTYRLFIIYMLTPYNTLYFVSYLRFALLKLLFWSVPFILKCEIFKKRLDIGVERSLTLS